MAAGGAAQRLPELFQLAFAPHEAGQPARRRRVKPRAQGASSSHLVDVDRFFDALDRYWSQGLHRHIPFRQLEGVGRQQHRARGGELFHARRQVGRLANRAVVDAEITPNGSHHHLPRVETHPDLRPNAMIAPHLLGVPTDCHLHVERGVACPHCVILVGEGGAEEGHDPVAHHLVHGALVAVDGLHHPFEHRIQKLSGLLRIPVGEQLHRAFQVGEQDGHLLAFPFQGGLRGEDAFG
jgi:hypothetical protein